MAERTIVMVGSRYDIRIPMREATSLTDSLRVQSTAHSGDTT